MHCLILADFWVFLSLRLRSLVWVVFLIVNSSLAIDMSKFKKCEDSSFCKFVYEMHQSILALPIQPPGICTFFFFKLTIPGGRAGKAWQCPGQKKDDKCPAPGHTDSFIECILDLQTSITLLASMYKSYSSHPNFWTWKTCSSVQCRVVNIQ
jgi:hypothetical protein